MGIKRILFYISLVQLYVSVVVNQFARVQFSGFALSLLDISLLVFLLFNLPVLFTKSKLPLRKPFLIFTGICILSLLVNWHFFTNSEMLVSFAYLVRFMLYFLTFFISYNLDVHNKKILKNFLFISGISILLIGFIQYKYYDSLDLFYLGWDPHL